MTPEAAIIQSMFNVIDKDSRRTIPFVLNSAQRQVDENLTGRDIIPKARQRGVSTYFLARFLVKCLSQENTNAVVISHETEATQRLLARVRFFLDTIRGPKAEISNMSANMIGFARTNSTFFIGTAGARAFGRGDTITHLHCSELAFWPDAKTLLVGLLQAVPKSGEIAIESSGNGAGNEYHGRCMDASARLSNWQLHFLPFQDDEGYTDILTEEQEAEILRTLDPELEEPELSSILTPGQLAWRRRKIIDDFSWDLDKFKQEYPMSLDECFLASGRGIFTKINFVPTSAWKPHPEDRRLKVLDGHPNPTHRYLLGGDVAAGVGSDRSVWQIIDIDEYRQVGEWVHDRTDPEVFGLIGAELGRTFNLAMISCENNNHGILTIKVLLDNYPDPLVYRDLSSAPKDDVPILLTYGVKTTVRTKPLLIGNLRSAVKQEFTIHSPDLKDEMNTYQEDENGEMGAQDNCFDDRVMASAVGLRAYNQAAMIVSASIIEPPPKPKIPVFTVTGQDILDEMHGRARGTLPIGRQA